MNISNNNIAMENITIVPQNFDIQNKVIEKYKKPLTKVINEIIANLEFKSTAPLSPDTTKMIHNYFDEQAQNSIDKIAGNFSSVEKVSTKELKKIFIKTSKEKKWDRVIAEKFLGLQNKPIPFFKRNWSRNSLR